MKAYLRIDPVYADQFSDVWLWGEWPGNGGKHDTGIDLVAQDRDTGHLRRDPVQVLRADDHGLQADDRLASSPRRARRLRRADHRLHHRQVEHATPRTRSRTRPSPGTPDRPQRPRALPGRLAVPRPRPAQDRARPPHQEAAARAPGGPRSRRSTAGFGEHDRGKLIMACGTGKTFTSLRLAEQNVGAGGNVLFLVPSISLLSQTLREWIAEAELPIRAARRLLGRRSRRKRSVERRGHLRHRPRAAGDHQRRRCSSSGSRTPRRHRRR